MNIALIGHGTMGRAVERQALELGHTITAVLTTTSDIQNADLSTTDVAMEFSTPACAQENVLALARKKVGIVCGTTGWNHEMPSLKEDVAMNGIGFLWSPNFSIGVNAYWWLLKHAARLMDRLPAYDVYGHEFHHKNKADSPSGTAKATAEILTQHLTRKTDAVFTMLDRKIEPHELHFSSTRGGAVAGTHSVYFDSGADTIEITHSARNSNGFAVGAVVAAEWLKGKRGWFQIDDVLADIFPPST